MSKPLTPADLQAIRERLEASSAGGWRLAHENMLGSTSSVVEGPAGDICRPYRREDGRFIAHAHQDVPRLLDEVEELRLNLAAAERDLASARELLVQATAMLAADKALSGEG